MADSTTTGSAIFGSMNPGMQNGLMGTLGSQMMTDRIIVCYGSPQNVVTASIGSQIILDSENSDFYMAVAQNGSSWNRLGSLT